MRRTLRSRESITRWCFQHVLMASLGFRVVLPWAVRYFQGLPQPSQSHSSAGLKSERLRGMKRLYWLCRCPTVGVFQLCKGYLFLSHLQVSLTIFASRWVYASSDSGSSVTPAQRMTSNVQWVHSCTSVPMRSELLGG